MTKNEICTLYEDLNKLLNDICELLSEEIQNDKISLKNRNVANQLIERSKKQLQNISRVVSSSTDTDSGSYMDMNKKSEYVDPDKKLNEENHEIYSDVEYIDPESTSGEGQIICPYELTPAQELPDLVKCGYLDRKERFLFIEHQKRIYAAICKTWMMIYSSDKDQKPNDALDLRTYEAKPIENQKDAKKRDEKCFELISLRRTRSYQFTAITPKDMLQWVAAIERRNHSFYSHSVKRINDVNHEKSPEYVDDENIYEKLRDDVTNHHETKIKDDKNVLKPTIVPSLPPRIARNHYVINRPVPSVPTDGKEEYDPANHESSENSMPSDSQSFSDEDSDNIYDMLITESVPGKANQPQEVQADINHKTVLHDDTQLQPMKTNVNTTMQNVEDEETDAEYDVIQIDFEQQQTNSRSSVKVLGTEIKLDTDTKMKNTSVKVCQTTMSTKMQAESPKQIGEKDLNKIACDVEDDADILYDFIQSNSQPQIQPNSTSQSVKSQAHRICEAKTEKVKPEVPKTKPNIKPKVLNFTGKETRQSSKINSLVQQLTKKTKT